MVSYLLGAPKLEILWLTPSVPAPTTGAGTRIFSLMKELRAYAEVDLIAGSVTGEAHPETVQAIRGLCRMATVVPSTIASDRQKRLLQFKSLTSRHPMQRRLFYSPEMQNAIHHALANTGYDIVLLESSLMGYYTLPTDGMVVVDQHNVESEVLYRSGRRERSKVRRLYNTLEFVKYRADEVRFCRRADLIIATSERDRKHMVGWGELPPCVVIPNGVNTHYFSPGIVDAVMPTPSVVFTGTMSYAPNTEAMLYFAHDIWPQVRQQVPQATLAIVGQNPPPVVRRLQALPGVSVTGSVPDVRPYIAGAQVVVAPLRIGGGTRLKILEAMAMGRAVVSSSLGCEGLDVQDGNHLVIADEPNTFATRVVELLNNPQRRSALGRRGRQLVEEQYDWHRLGATLQRVLFDCVGDNPHLAPGVQAARYRSLHSETG